MEEELKPPHWPDESMAAALKYSPIPGERDTIDCLRKELDELRAEVLHWKTKCNDSDGLLEKNAEHLASHSRQIGELVEDKKRLDWLDLHCAFVADEGFKIGPYKTGELRKMADDGLRSVEQGKGK